MPFPAVGAILGRLAVAAGGMFARGAGGAAGGAAGAVGGAAAAGGAAPTIMPAVLQSAQSLQRFSYQIQTATAPIQEMGAAAQSAAEKMKAFSPAAAQVGRFEEVRELIRERDSGQRMAPEMMALAKERQEMLDNIRPIREFLWTFGMRFQRAMLAIINKIFEICQAIYGLFKPVIDPFMAFMRRVGEWIDWMIGKDKNAGQLDDAARNFAERLARGELERRRNQNQGGFR